MGTEQQFCLKWNNHRTTILSVFDTLLEEESLVDVTLSAEGQFLRAHRVILSACSPYFRTLFRSSFLNDKHPVVFMKDVDFENLKGLVEYMYKGEANVPQHMLPSFIRTAESLQIRGLAEGANKHFDGPETPGSKTADGPPGGSSSGKKSSNGGGSGTGILAARLAKMVDHHPPSFVSPYDFPAEALSRLPGAAAAAAAAAGGPLPSHNQRKRRKSDSKEAKKDKKQLTPKSANVPPSGSLSTNNNFEEEGVLKIDEDVDPGKENRESPIGLKDDADKYDDTTNGVDSEEEEPSMPGPNSAMTPAASIINPWTGEAMSPVIDEHDENSGQGDNSGPIFPLMDPSLISRSAAASELDRTPPPTPNRGSYGSAPGGSGGGGEPFDRDPLTNKYACTRCGRSYLHQATLVRHQRYECGISASYPCSLCGRKFKRRDVLKGHMEKCVNKSVQGAAAAAASAVAAAATSPAVSAFPTTLSS